jgi:gamma-glutamyltranspeptidase
MEIKDVMRNFELPGRSAAVGRRGMAATSHTTATLAAIEALRDGDNAIDAAVTACAVQCVVEAGSTGVGGDCFALLSRGGSADVIAYNGSGRTPLAATPEWYERHGVTAIDRHSPHAVTVPGAVEAWWRLIKDHGRRTLADALEPAIALARDGMQSHRASPTTSASSAIFSAATRPRRERSSATANRPMWAPSSVNPSSRKPWRQLAATVRTLSIVARSPKTWSPISAASADCIRRTISFARTANT